MTFTKFSIRDIIVSNDDEICNDSSAFQCPQVIESIGWGQSCFFVSFLRTTSHFNITFKAVLLFAFVLLIWKLVYDKRRKTQAANKSNSKEDHEQLSLPYPQPPSELYEDVSTKELGSDSCKLGHDQIDEFFLY